MQYISNLAKYTMNTFVYNTKVFNQKIFSENLGPLVVLLVGVALKIFRYQISIPLMIYSSSFFCGRLIIEIGKNYQIFILNQGTSKLREMVSKNPRLRLFSFLFSLVVCKKFPKLSILSAFIAGWLAATLLGTSKQSHSENSSKDGSITPF